MRPGKTGMRLRAAVLCAAAWGMSQAGHAATISIKGHSPADVKDSCKGGQFVAQTEPGGVYACIASDGSGIVCGGKGKYSKTCSTYGASARIRSNELDAERSRREQGGTGRK